MSTKAKIIVKNTLITIFAFSFGSAMANTSIWPRLNIDLPNDEKVETRIQQMLEDMTLEQKIAQMIQPEIRDITVEDMRKYGFGSYLNGGGSFPHGNKHSSIDDWVTFADDLYLASIDDSIDGSSIPTMWGTDAVHGHNNVIGATIFPHNIGLGAANNPALITEIAKVTSVEVQATGIDWIFAPTVATVRDDRWGRTYEGYSEDPDIVKSYAKAIVEGLQGQGDDFMSSDKVISTVKHFLGDGGTVGGDDQGNNIDTEQTLFDIHAQGYISGLSAGALTVMASFNSWHGDKIHGSKYLLTDVLKDKLGFTGFVVGDWAGHGQVKGCSNQSCPQSINAGLDVFMAPTSDWKPLYENTLAQAKSGEIPMSRINDAVSRILRVKILSGLFEKPRPKDRPFAGNESLIGAPEHREVARRAVRESLVLLKNKENILPLNPKQKILVAGDAANNITKQSGGWTITWQGTGNNNEDFPGATSIYDGLSAQVKAAGGEITLSEDGQFDKRPDVAIVVFGENPYAEGHGDRADLEYQPGNKQDLRLLKKFQSLNIPVVSVFISGRPMWVNPEINASDAFVAAWLPGSEGEGIADVILADKKGKPQHQISGKLSYSWPQTPFQMINRHDSEYNPLLPYGFGLSYGETGPLDNASLNETIEASNTALFPFPLFNGQAQAPWLLWMSTSEGRVQITSNTESMGKLKFRTIDRRIQEDAIKLSFGGGEGNRFYLASKSNFREDLRSLLLANGAIEFDIRLTSKLTAPLILRQDCDNPSNKNCGVSIDIAPYLKTNSDWQTVQLPMSCLKTGGMEYQNTVVPLLISTSAKTEVSISDIGFVKTDQDQHFTCPFGQ